VKPYFHADGIVIYHGDARELLPRILDGETPWGHDSIPAMLVSDPPYGIAYESGARRVEGNARSIVGDDDTSLRDFMVERWRRFGDWPALVFGSWKRPRPEHTKGVLVWDKGGALGMGDLRMPWKFDHEEIYVIGSGFVGPRDSGSVLQFAPEQSMGRLHPHQKPERLMRALVSRCPTTDGFVLDPFAGSCSTLRAAMELGRRAVGIEIDERYCEIAAKRMSQRVLGCVI